MRGLRVQAFLQRYLRAWGGRWGGVCVAQIPPGNKAADDLRKPTGCGKIRGHWQAKDAAQEGPGRILESQKVILLLSDWKQGVASINDPI